MTEPPTDKPANPQFKEELPNPPRFWWLKRLTVAGAIFLVAMAGLRAWWGREAQRRIDTIVSEAHARGEPILPEDFDSPSIPDSQNAAVPLRHLKAVFTLTTAESDFEPSTPYSASDFRTMDAFVIRHAAELQLIRSLRGYAKAEWGYRPRHVGNLPWFSWPWSGMVSFSKQRKIVVSLALCARFSHAKGNDAEAVEYIRDIFELRRCNANKELSDIGLLHMTGFDAWGANVVVELAPLLEISSQGVATTQNAVSTDQVHSLMSILLDDTAMREADCYCIMGDRMAVVDCASDLADLMVHPPVMAGLARPLFILDAARFADVQTCLIDALKKDDYFAARALLPASEESRLRNASSIERLAHPDNEIPVYSDSNIGSLLKRVFTEITNRRAAAVLLALRLYALDHHGHLPESLAALVPNYLPSIPMDPFARDRRPFGYLPHREPPAIYSVGANGIDKGGSEKRLDPRDGDRSGLENVIFPYGAGSGSTIPAETDNSK